MIPSGLSCRLSAGSSPNGTHGEHSINTWNFMKFGGFPNILRQVSVLRHPPNLQWPKITSNPQIAEASAATWRGARPPHWEICAPWPDFLAKGLENPWVSEGFFLDVPVFQVVLCLQTNPESMKNDYPKQHEDWLIFLWLHNDDYRWVSSTSE